MPPALEARPEIPEHLEHVWRGFLALESDRPRFWDVGPISYVAIDRYAARNRIDGDAFDRFAELIRRIDAADLKVINRKSGTG